MKKQKPKAYAFCREIKQSIEKYHMLETGDGVVAGISGGADSLCLLYVLCALQEEYKLRLAALHINHGIRGEEADADEEFVRRECEKLGVVFRAVHRDVPALAAQWGMTEEEAGRRTRYEAFYHAALELGYEKIAVAHNENDSAETFLFQALRGSGVWGLSGIAPIRKEYGTTIIRPLLFVSRARIEEFLEEEGHPFCTDRTNLSKDYTRNRIRSELLPMAAEMVNAGAVSHLAQAAAQMYELSGFLQTQVEEAYQRAVREEGAENKEISIDISVYKQLPSFLQREVVFRAVGRAAGGQRDIARTHIEAVCNLICAQTGRRISLPHEIFAVRQYGQVLIAPREGREHKMPQLDPESYFCVDTIPKVLTFGQYELNLYLSKGNLTVRCAENEKNSLNERNCYTKCFDYDKIENILILRTKRPGDYLQINGGTHRKRLKDLFTDMKVPGEYRERLPLLTMGSHVLWAVGVRSSEGFLATENTKQILVVELKKRGKKLQWQKK